ncbi:MAG: hypothetical protein H7259_11030 [Cytophagales bacterium]|nr:hypothetical protein [Cytophaga sp.]
MAFFFNVLRIDFLGYYNDSNHMTPTERLEEEKKLAACKEQLKIIINTKSNVTHTHSEERNEVTNEYVEDKITILEKEIAELQEKLGVEA